MRLFFFLIIFAINAHSQVDSVLLFGHRGCRGFYPENSIKGFKYAISVGVKGIELDVVVNKDKQLVVSHEPYFQREFCLGPDSLPIKDEKEYNIYTMTQDEISAFDCGSILNKDFPHQLKNGSTKPLLKEVFEEVDFSKTTILFEIKSNPREDNNSQPVPAEFAQIIYQEVKDFQFKSNIIFMSFDKRILEELYLIAPEHRFVYLTYKPFTSPRRFLKELTFQPYGLAMFYPTIRKRKANYIHQKGMQLFAWNVNGEKRIIRLAKKGVDGVITDYPDVTKYF